MAFPSTSENNYYLMVLPLCTKLTAAKEGKLSYQTWQLEQKNEREWLGKPEENYLWSDNMCIERHRVCEVCIQFNRRSE